MDPGTILSDDETYDNIPQSDSDSETEHKAAPKSKKKRKAADASGFASGFSWDTDAPAALDDLSANNGGGWDFRGAMALLAEHGAPDRGDVLGDAVLARHMKKKRLAADADGGGDGGGDSDADAPMDEDGVRDMGKGGPAPGASRRARGAAAAAESTAERAEAKAAALEAAAAAEFFDEYVEGDAAGAAAGAVAAAPKTWHQLNLSRPLLRAIEALGFVTPTRVQAATIPPALAGRDVCVSAVTGSGKTAAFSLPILERLLHRSSHSARASRVLIITPTRELAAQGYSMLCALAQFTDVTACLIVGGTKDLRPQEAALRRKPDVVVCTPGRMVDHLANSPMCHFDDVEILVLDEADRLLELGFRDEITHLVGACPGARQTMLFSATMTTTVADLTSLAMRKPVRVAADAEVGLAPRLVQEFVRIRAGSEKSRDAILLALVTRTFRERVIVFFDTKVKAHRCHLLFGLRGLKSAELHGGLTQLQRLDALDRFKTSAVDILVCTDLAARGLDINRVATVVNHEMPRAANTYVHRVGRTARAGCGGRSVTLVGDPRRPVMKAVLKTMDDDKRADVKARAVQPKVVEHYRTACLSHVAEIDALIADEADEKQLRIAEMEAHRALNLVSHEDEIMGRSARSWVVSEKEKKATLTAAKKTALTVEGTKTKKKAGDGDGDDGDGGRLDGDVRAKGEFESLETRAERRARERPATTHRTSRKQRRRDVVVEQGMVLGPKVSKNPERMLEHADDEAADQREIDEIERKAERKQNKREQRQGKRARQRAADVDAGLTVEKKVVNTSGSGSTKFTEFDAERVGAGKKSKPSGTFKSKKRYSRRG